MTSTIQTAPPNNDQNTAQHNAQPAGKSLYWLECKSELLKAIRTPQFSAPTIAFPVVFYLIFGVILAGENGGGRALYLLATFGMFGALGPALFGFGVNVANERNNGWLDLKKISPMPIAAYILAKLFMAAVFGLIVICLLSTIAVLFGGLEISLARWLLMTATQLLCAVPFALMGMAIGFRVSTEAAPAIVNILFMLMSVFGGLWLPITLFPDTIQQVAWILPTFHGGQLALASIGLSPIASPLTHAALLAGFAGVMALFAARNYRTMTS